MYAVPTMDRGDGRVAAEHAYLKQPVAKTAAYTILAAEAGTVYTNRGTSGSVAFTLPAPKPGMFFGFQKAVSNQTISLTTDVAGTKIHNVTQGVTLTDAVTEYAYVEIFSDGTAWFVRNAIGTWSVT